MKKYLIYSETELGYLKGTRLWDHVSRTSRPDWTKNIQDSLLFDSKEEVNMMFNVIGKLGRQNLKLMEIEVPDETGTVQEGNGGYEV